MPRKSLLTIKGPPGQYAPSCAPIETLPLELKLRIVSYLSYEDAVELALVSRNLQDAAESIIWSKIDMCLPITWEKQDCFWEDDMPDWWNDEKINIPQIQAEEIVKKVKSRSKSEKPECEYDLLLSDIDICCGLRQIKFLTRTKQVWQAIQSRPSRSGWVKELSLETPKSKTHKQLWIQPDINGELINIIHAIRGNIRILRIGPPDINLYESDIKLQTEDITVFSKSSGLHLPHTPKLHTLETVLSNKSPLEHQLSSIFSVFGTSLTCFILNPAWPNTDISSSSEPNPKSEDMLDLPALKSLKLRELRPGSIQSICKLIDSAKNLGELIIHFTEQKRLWQSSSDRLTENEIKILREHKGLKRIEWYGGLDARWWFEKICESGFDNINILVQSQAVECESETFIENILIPPFPSLQAIVIPCRTTKWYRHLAPPDWAKAPPPRNSISPHVITHLRSAPNVVAVQFSCLSSLSSEEVLSSPTWCDKRVNGVLLRSYLNNISGEEFYHLRRLELLTVQPKIYDYTYSEKYKELKGCKGDEIDHRWVDHTWYKSVPVPPPILKKVYKLLGAKSQWTNPGRGLELPESAWEVLRKWRVKLPDRGVQERTIVTRRMTRGTAPTS
ncbi:uncharacterized protein IL334_006199 [Kwoniella shivajii]|uniref:F-box domain-containing protein n=1 Tax=Kwoniella shivajii TaxID=564305 RepID=A0ABZ1D755_9TREE|nr:hypothetical protein IL334_006199 [Kwoniella shivajii]